MISSKLLVSTAAALAVIGAAGFTYAQTAASPGQGSTGSDTAAPGSQTVTTPATPGNPNAAATPGNPNTAATPGNPSMGTTQRPSDSTGTTTGTPMGTDANRAGSTSTGTMGTGNTGKTMGTANTGSTTSPGMNSGAAPMDSVERAARSDRN